MNKILAVFMIVMASAVFTASPSFADKDKKQCDKKGRYGGHGGGHWLGGKGVNVEIKETENGVVVTYSSKNKDKVKELHIKSKMMNLKRELKELN